MQVENPFDSCLPCLQSLFGQAVDQIEIQVVEPSLARDVTASMTSKKLWARSSIRSSSVFADWTPKLMRLIPIFVIRADFRKRLSQDCFHSDLSIFGQ